MNLPEGVNVPELCKVIEKRSFLRKKPGVHDVVPGPRKIDGPVRYVEVTADNDGLALPEFLGVVGKHAEKPHLVFQALELSLMLPVPAQNLRAAVREIPIDKVELFKFHMDNTAFALVGGIRQFQIHGQWLQPGEHSHTGISFFHGTGGPVGLPALRTDQFRLQLIRRGLCLLESDNLCGLTGEPLPVRLGRYGSDAVHIPRNKSDLHAPSSGCLSRGKIPRTQVSING